MRIGKIRSSTKIIGTIGPASESPEILKGMIQEGLDVARINCSHSSPDDLVNLINAVNKTSQDLGIPLSILADLSGPKIRLGKLTNDIPVKSGDTIILTSDPDQCSGNRLTAGYPGLANDVTPGHIILIDDGLVQLEVIDIASPDIKCRVLNDGMLKSRKGINLPGVPISLSALTDKDRRDIEILVTLEIDYIALSFVRRKEDIQELRNLLTSKNCTLPIIAKIEKPEALDDLQGIVEEADIIMVARGDLGVEIPTEDVPVIQKKIISLCNSENKPVITATQMLDSMITNPRPTRAEASDVANAVFDGSDAVMLSGETSVGEFPVEAIKTMKKIVITAERNLSPDRLMSLRRREKLKTHEAYICNAACIMGEQSNAGYIVAITRTGRTAQLLSQYRTSIPILAFTEIDSTIRYLNIVWGVIGEKITDVSDTDSTLQRALVLAKEKGYRHRGYNHIYDRHPPSGK